MSEEKNNTIDEDLLEHFINVDDNITVSIKIPKIMNAMTFKGLTQKASKIFNIAQVEDQIVSSISGEIPYVPKKTFTAKGKYKRVWSEEALQYIVQAKKDQIAMPVVQQELKDKYGVNVTIKGIWQKLWYLKSQNKRR